MSSGLGRVFRSCGWVAVPWSHLVPVDTEDASSALPRWCLEPERAVRCLNPCWTRGCSCCDGFAEDCFTDLLEKTKCLYRLDDHSRRMKC